MFPFEYVFFQKSVSKRYSELVQKWVESIRTYMPDFPDDISNNRICQLHFDPEDLKLSRGELQLRFGAIPTRFPRCVCVLHFVIRMVCNECRTNSIISLTYIYSQV